MSNGIRRSLPFADWPESDQELWLGLIADGDILEGGGPGAPWAPATKANTRKAYAYWLQWLNTTGQLDPGSDPLDRITPDRVAAYIESRRGDVASLTTFVYILDLLRLAQAVSNHDWTWLKGIKNRLWARATPARDKTSKIRHASDLFALGLDLMNEADGITCRYNPFAAEGQYRDGLIIALLAARPVRLKNLTSIEIGRHLVQADQTYWLVFEAREVKNRKHIEVSLPEVLTEYLDRYLMVHRRRLLGATNSDRLWISGRGTPLGDSSIRHQLKQRTAQAFGEAITPHLFRDCAATSIAIDDPEHVRV
ncbi:MAG: tyrosine-type recombinase/integrase, partial [Rhodospirillaceae bacterium]|nr:tyrosine-type recombinase/integrase [Rhodospirillaceae bacterium]